MTYCIGLLVADGLVFAADSRTNAGFDRVATMPKMTVFERPGDRLLVLLSAGNLSITQSTVSLLQEWQRTPGPRRNLLKAPSMFAAARIVGTALREIERVDGPALQQHSFEFNGEFIFGGQIRGGPPRLFHVYAPGNFVEASADTPYFQIGEVKYGKPIIDRVVTYATPMAHVVKCALLSFDSTMQSNVSVGPPLHLLCTRRDSLRVGLRRRIEMKDAYFSVLRQGWGDGLQQLFDALPLPDWPIEGAAVRQPATRSAPGGRSRARR